MVGDEHRARRFPIWSELGSTTARPEYWPSSCWEVTSLTTLLLYLTLFQHGSENFKSLLHNIIDCHNPCELCNSARSSFGILVPIIYLGCRMYASFHCFASLFAFVMPHIFVFAQTIPPDLVLVWWLLVLRCIVWILVQTTSGQFTIFKFHCSTLSAVQWAYY